MHSPWGGGKSTVLNLLEAELAELSPEDAAEFRGGGESALGEVVRRLAETLDLITFFTAGEKETRAWTLRRGETLLLTLGIPVVFLLFFSKVSVVSTPTTTPADFFVPGILALAVMSTAIAVCGVSASIAVGGAVKAKKDHISIAIAVALFTLPVIMIALSCEMKPDCAWTPGLGALSVSPTL